MELSNYQLESSTSVRLFFKNGGEKLVSKTELGSYLTPLDAERVQQAFAARQMYFNELPNWIRAIVLVVLALGLGYGTVKAAPDIQRVLHTIVPAIPAPAEPITNTPSTHPVDTAPPVQGGPSQASPEPTPVPSEHSTGGGSHERTTEIAPPVQQTLHLPAQAEKGMLHSLPLD